MRVLISSLALAAALAPGLAHAQTVTVQTDDEVPPPPPAQGQAQVQVQVQPAPQPQPQPQPYVQPQQQPTYYQPAPVPQREQRTRTRPTLGLVIPGAIMFGVSWILHAALISPFAGYNGIFQPEWSTFRWTGVIPVVGPWVQMAVKPGSFDQDSWGGYLAVNGLLQAAGVTMFILGFVFQETETYYVEGEGDFRWAVMPTASPDGGGLSAVGQF